MNDSSFIANGGNFMFPDKANASTNQKRELPMCGHSLIARLTIAVFVFQMLGVTSVVHAQRPDSTAGTSIAGTRRLFVNPSSASVALGKASLIVSPLTHRDGNYVGDYQLKVKPYFFKSEKGSLLLAASDDAVRKLQANSHQLYRSGRHAQRRQNSYRAWEGNTVIT